VNEPYSHPGHQNARESHARSHGCFICNLLD
jgi:hypothetical protein